MSREFDIPEAEGYGLYMKSGKIWLRISRRWTDYSLRLQTRQALELNRWHHVVMTYDGKKNGSGVKICVNGEPQQIEILFDELNTHWAQRSHSDRQIHLRQRACLRARDQREK